MKRIAAPLVYRGPDTEWERHNTPSGATFEITQAFKDADGDLHPAGERWILLGTRFNKFDNEIELGVRAPDGADWLMRLGWDKERQGAVIDEWSSYTRNLA